MNPFIQKAPGADKMIYTDPKLAPGGGGNPSATPEPPPAVSAYTGLGDVPPPAGYPSIPQVSAPPVSVSDMLMPPNAPAPSPEPPLPAESPLPQPGGHQ
jgi:hypothetical protein